MDNSGKIHKFLIPKSSYVNQGGAQILSPKQWAQAQRNEKTIQGIGSYTDAREVKLYWGQRK